MDALRYEGVHGFAAVYFRRTYPQLVAPDGLWDLSRQLYGVAQGRARENTHEWRFPNGARVVMSHLQYESDVYSHQGAQYCGIYYDELTHFTARQFWYLLSRNRSTCGVRPFIRANCNPDPDSFVADLVSWWIGPDGMPIEERSGRLRWFIRDGEDLRWADTDAELRARYPGREPLSFTFIGARLDDNPILDTADPSYRSRLETLNFVERERLLSGNWKVRPAAGLYFKPHWFKVFDEIPGAVEAEVRGWDKAATEPHQGNTDPDWTRGVRIARLSQGSPVRYIVCDVHSMRAGPGDVDRAMRNVASQDSSRVSVALWQDPGQAGVVDIAHSRRNLDGYTLLSERASQSKVAYAGPFSSACEGGLVGLLRGGWNEGYLAELAGFPEGGHDDQVDASALAYLKLSTGGARRAAPAGNDGQSRWRRM
jgi:predicted phage terminase large subunit-like protein